MGAGELSGEGGGKKGGQYPYSLHASRCGCLVRVSGEEGGGVGVWCDGGGNTPGVSWAARVQI